MRIAVAISLILLISMPLLMKMGILGNYWMQQDYYATVLCIQRDKPESTCNGKCVLSDALKQIDNTNKEDSFPYNRLLQVDLPFFLDFVISSINSGSTKFCSNLLIEDEEGVDSQYMSAVFRPPVSNS